MATVELSFAVRPAHVRTARQVAVTLARRAKLAESDLETIRLAVGEACGLVVGLQRSRRSADPVHVVFDDDDGLSIDVRGSLELEDGEGQAAIDVLSALARPHDELPVGASLAVVSELAPRLDVTTSPTGVRLAMGWPPEAVTHG